MMEESLSGKAPATRSRRRISVDQVEENKSPAINTPTKKRGGRRGVKPDLELIDENTPENATTRRTTKTLATKDIEDSQEKAVTPSRRSTRIKSNTSIVSETAIAIDSPRSKRAARRASQAGSDGEAQNTPIRQTRRTRKDSASSIDKEHQIPTKQGVQITEIIIEEPEINTKNTQAQIEITINENISPNNTRRSPRLLEKNKITTPAKSAVDDQEDSTHVSEAIGSSKKNKDDINSSTISSTVTNNPISETLTKNKLDESQISEKNRLSISSANLIKELDAEKTKFTMNLNKSVSDAECKENKIKRHRTKSWSTITTLHNIRSSIDSGTSKDKIKSHLKFSFRLDDKSRSGNGSLKDSENVNKSYPNGKAKDSTNFISENNGESLDTINNVENIANESEDNNLSLKKKMQQSDLLTSELLSKEPSGNIKTTIFIDDSDSNSEKIKIQSRHKSEDQCVPVVDNPMVVIPRIDFFPSNLGKSDHNIINKLDLTKTIDSCEPMDVDETMPENTILSETPNKEPRTSERKSTCDFTDTNLSSKQTANDSEKRISGQNLDKSEIETKSTLILSQLKDNSIADNNISSTATSQVTNRHLSKTVDDLNISHENDLKKNISLHCSTSTPLQDKNIQKFKGIQADFASNANESKIRSTDSESKNAVKHVFHEAKSMNISIEYKGSESSEDEDNLKKSFCKDQGQKISEQQVSITSTKNSHLKKDKKIDTDNNSSSKKSKNENHEKEELFMQQQESHSSDEEGNSNNKESNKLTKSKKIVSDVSSSEADEINSDDSQEKSNFADHEAVDAGTDYESGDSQDESELQYQRENEIIDRGETLSTEEEFSEDSDYEKDSFIVSSNEDEELLDGTDDDLSMSDNELKMNAKSKKKYNDRKMKEQKKASREMFESRHKLKSSTNNPFTEKGVQKKNKRRQLSSSESEEDVVKPRKINRRRLDSTKEATLIKDENELKISMKNNVSLSDNADDVNDADEIEMTIYNESVRESDPLSNNSKKENINSTEDINSMENIIRIDKNASTDKAQIELLKSFEGTITDGDDDSLSSDNENIIQNYDSILKDLNKTKTDITNIGNSSLNRVTKTIKKDKPSIFEDLNLTQVKTIKTDKSKHNDVTNNNSRQEILSKTDLNDDSSSDSIDLHLLFSEESNNSEDVQSKKNNTTNSDDFTQSTETEDKPDMKESKGKENDVNFFIDTVGSFRETLNKSHNISLIENKRASMEIGDDTDSNKDLPQTVTSTTKKLSLDQMENDLAEAGNSDDEAPLEISYQKKKESKRKSKEQDTLNIPMVETAQAENSDDVAPLEISYQKKKESKRKSKEQDALNIPMVETEAVNKSLKTPGSEKKKKKSLNARYDEQNDFSNDLTANDSILNTSAKKTSGKKNKRQSETHCEGHNDEPQEATNRSVIVTPASEKKKICQSESLSADKNELLVGDLGELFNISKATTPGSQKKKSHKKLLADGGVQIETENSGKKSKKSPLKQFALDEENTIVPEESAVHIETTSNKRKRKSSIDISKEEILSKDIDAVETVDEPEIGSKKKKRKISSTQDEIVPDIDASETVDEPVVENKKKKRKISPQDEIVLEAVRKEQPRDEHLENYAQKIKFEQFPLNNRTGTDELNKKRNKKRKEREDDGANPISKMRKEITFDKVPRLPSSLIMKLDKESQENVTEKPAVVSTTQFLVQKMKKKKSKPSKYLEDSVYLNEDDENVHGRRKQRKLVEKPKVLPFVPTASISNSGYTTTFKVNVIPREIKFVAQNNTVSNFRDNYLYNKKIKRFGTYEMYKRQRSAKISKY